MSDVDNPEVDAGAAATEGQSQGGALLSGQEGQVQMQEQSQEVADWKTALPDDLKSAKSLASIKSVEDLAKGYVNAQSVVGRRFEDLTPEQLSEYYTAQGRPETPDGYNFEVPEGLQVDKDIQDWYKQKAHELGLNETQAKSMYEDFAKMEAEKVNQAAELQAIEMEKQAEQLKKDFGPAFDERVELANRALKEFGGDEAIQQLAEMGLSNNPTVVKMLANAGMMLAEGKFTEGSSTGKFGMTSEEATQKIDGLRTDPEFMKHYADPSSPKHKEAASQLQDLYKIKVNSAG